MKWSEQRWLQTRVQAWQEAGLVTEPQATQIEKFEEEANQKRASGFEMLAYLGGLCIALGIILLIGYNWENIPPPVRQLGFMATLTGVAFGAHWFATHLQLSAALQMIWLILPLAGIGLWGQVYNLSGDAYKPLFLWSVLSFPIALLGAQTPVRWFYTVGFALSLFVGAYAPGSFLNIEHHTQGAFPLWQCLGLFVLWGCCLAQAYRWLGEKGQWHVLLLTLGFIFSVPLAIDYFDFEFGNVAYALVGSLVPFYWAVQQRLHNGSGWWHWTGRLGIIIALYTLTFDNSALGAASKEPTAAVNLYITVLLLLGAGLLLYKNSALKWPPERSHTFFIALQASPFLMGIAMFGMTEDLVQVAGNLLVLACGVEAIIHGVDKRMKSSLNLGLLTVGGLLLIRFIDYFGTMLQSGLAFVVSGIFLIALSYGLHKARLRFMEEMK